MAHILHLLSIVTVWLSSAAGLGSSVYFDYEEVEGSLDAPLELTCGVPGNFRHCAWETEDGDVFQMEDIQAGLYPGMRASSNLTHNQCGIVVEHLTKKNLGKWTCRVFLPGLTLKAERNVGKAVNCHDVFTQVGNKCYYIHHTTKMNWDDARTFCQGLDHKADLAVVTDCHQFELLWNKILVDYQTTWYWIGGSDRHQESSWHWVTGEAIASGTPYWYPGRPNGDGGCLHFFDPYGYFNDYNCTEKGYFVCQLLY